MRLTLRELIAAADARRRDEWDRASQLLAVLINAHRKPEASPVHADDLNPYRRRKRSRRRSLQFREAVRGEYARLAAKSEPVRVSASSIHVVEE